MGVIEIIKEIAPDPAGAGAVLIGLLAIARTFNAGQRQDRIVLARHARRMRKEIRSATGKIEHAINGRRHTATLRDLIDDKGTGLDAR